MTSVPTTAARRGDALQLTPAEARAWREEGYFVRREQFGADELARLRDAADAAERTAIDACADGRSYLLDGRRFVDVGPVTVQFEQAPDRPVVKVIEPVSEIEPAFSALIDDARLVAPLCDLLGTRTLSLWTDKLNLKRPGVGSGFGWHQDSPYWIHDCAHVDLLPNVMVSFDDAHADNGCLRVIRGSHGAGCLPGTDDGTQLGGFYTDPSRFDRSAEVALAVPAGSLIFFSPHLVHGSLPNSSPEPRRAMVLTYQPGAHPTLKTRCLRPVRT
ncbi:MAG: phytanoyl-CoA dioxygenase family protein [Pseudomonadales bacterium]|nr:phytanoyl-CoA dioxygenase family protein [Pseudomonadales bacterium]